MTTQLMIPENALTINETEAFQALTFVTNASLKTISEHSHVPENLYDEASRLGLIPSGPVQYIYNGVDGNEDNVFRLAIALPIEQPGERPFAFVYRKFPVFRHVSYAYTGPWSDLLVVYDALFSQLYRNGYTNDGRVREVYRLVDLENQANNITDIQIGLAPTTH
ncbi:GyrI-like domain-containing protein [Spirosoma utsteinense]|uniref:Effector-binding domain-containing protein n=1 Tax=Spirosoma utsteinense TaxID=2585773 RepID=A0ABR6W3E8_9BACT|nr:GyrI-like domain-containing protein [Spirosoma utsteinense]MBC3784839.1 effector-binding domain-containing protein [Spirosoma utsteinense]MBC3791123.1 effector-binding domain-containing protein [Spirosoma utsteinense]